MTDKKQPVLTRAQAHFLADLDLTSFTRKVEAIERAKAKLNFKDDADKENFYAAVERGYWDVRSEYSIVNPLLPFEQTLFVAQGNVVNPVNGQKNFYLTSEFNKAKLFTKEELNENEAIAMYNADEFILNEYEAVKKYGDVKAWLQEEIVELNDENVSEVQEIATDTTAVVEQAEGDDIVAQDEDLDETPTLAGNTRAEEDDLGETKLITGLGEHLEVVAAERKDNDAKKEAHDDVKKLVDQTLSMLRTDVPKQHLTVPADFGHHEIEVEHKEDVATQEVPHASAKIRLK